MYGYSCRDSSLSNLCEDALANEISRMVPSLEELLGWKITGTSKYHQDLSESSNASSEEQVMTSCTSDTRNPTEHKDVLESLNTTSEKLHSSMATSIDELPESLLDFTNNSLSESQSSHLSWKLHYRPEKEVSQTMALVGEANLELPRPIFQPVLSPKVSQQRGSVTMLISKGADGADRRPQSNGQDPMVAKRPHQLMNLTHRPVTRVI